MSYGIRLAFVFDGKPPQLKFGEIERRVALKQEALKKFEAAEKEENLEEMRKYAARTSRLTKDMVEEAKELISALGCPVVQAPSEGEAQAAFMVAKGGAYAVVSEDYDSLLFGCPRVIKNLTITARKKQKSKLAYDTIKPTMISLQDNLKELGISQDQLIVLAILVGTDFNPGGIKGIGQKKALKLVKEHGTDFNRLFAGLNKDNELGFDWEEVFHVIKDMPTTEDYWLVWKGINRDKVKEILVDKHDFSAERVEATISKLQEDRKTREQKGLSEFMG
jgi:flap endonuclease-1